MSAKNVVQTGGAFDLGAKGGGGGGERGAKKDFEDETGNSSGEQLLSRKIVGNI